MVKNRYIKVKFTKEGIHKFPGADKDPKYATGNWDDVSFLGYPHRHMFYFYVTLGVTHNDRDVEFIQFKRELERLFTKNVLHLDYQSCEMIAENLINYIENHKIKPLVAKSYPLKEIKQAQLDFLSKKFTGKLVLVPPDDNV